MVKQDRHGYFIKGAYYEGIHPSTYPVEVKKYNITNLIDDRHTRPIPDNHPLKYNPLTDAPVHYPVCNCKCGDHDTVNDDELPIWTYPLIGAFVALVVLFTYMFKMNY